MTDPTVAEAWVAAPLRRLMEDARLISGVMLYPTGRAVGQFGFSNAADVMSICALTVGLGGTGVGVAVGVCVAVTVGVSVIVAVVVGVQDGGNPTLAVAVKGASVARARAVASVEARRAEAPRRKVNAA